MPHALSSLDVMFHCRNLDKRIYLFQAKNLLQAETHFQPLHLLESHHGSPIIVNIGSKCHGVQMKEFFTHTQRCMHIESDISQPSNQPSYNKNSCPTHISTIFGSSSIIQLVSPKKRGFFVHSTSSKQKQQQTKTSQKLGPKRGHPFWNSRSSRICSFVEVIDFVFQDVWGCPKQKKDLLPYSTLPFLQKNKSANHQGRFLRGT